MASRKWPRNYGNTLHCFRASPKHRESLKVLDARVPRVFPGAALFVESAASDVPLMNMSPSLPVAEIERVARSHGAQSVRVFGSRARGDAGPESDLDLLVGLEPGRSLLDLIAIKQDLSAARPGSDLAPERRCNSHKISLCCRYLDALADLQTDALAPPWSRPSPRAYLRRSLLDRLSAPMALGFCLDLPPPHSARRRERSIRAAGLARDRPRSPAFRGRCHLE